MEYKYKKRCSKKDLTADSLHILKSGTIAFNHTSDPTVRRYTDVQLDDLLTHFLHTHSLTEGSRNHSYLSLGQYARYKSLTYADYERLTEMAHSMYGDSEYTLNRIRECMEWGYNHDEEQQNCKTNYSKTVSVPFPGPEDDPWRKSTKSTKSTMDTAAPENGGQGSDNQCTYDEMVCDTCPDFPDEVYEKLPSFFEPLLENTPSKRDKTLLFMGLIGTISAAMPNVRVLVRDKEYSTNLFFLGIAPAGTGKIS